jgi:hypothetical protein
LEFVAFLILLFMILQDDRRQNNEGGGIWSISAPRQASVTISY